MKLIKWTIPPYVSSSFGHLISSSDGGATWYPPLMEPERVVLGVGERLRIEVWRDASGILQATAERA